MGLRLTPRYLSAQADCGVAPDPVGTWFSRLYASLPVMYEAIVTVVGVFRGGGLIRRGSVNVRKRDTRKPRGREEDSRSGVYNDPQFFDRKLLAAT